MTKQSNLSDSENAITVKRTFKDDGNAVVLSINECQRGMEAYLSRLIPDNQIRIQKSPDQDREPANANKMEGVFSHLGETTQSLTSNHPSQQVLTGAKGQFD